MTGNLPLDAFLFGLLSAASLPLGAVVSFYWTPSNRTVAALMAFGGGALLAALTIDLAAPALERGHFYALAGGCIIGAILFDILNQIVNSQGGFLRKSATTINHLRQRKLQSYKKVCKKLSEVPLFQHLPPEEIRTLIPHIHSRSYKSGQIIVAQGDAGDSLFIIESGEVDIIDDANGRKEIARLSRGDIFGEMALVTHEPRSASAFTITKTKVWMIYRSDFELIAETSHGIRQAVKTLTEERISDLQAKDSIDQERANQWFKEASDGLSEQHVNTPTKTEVQEAASEHSGAPLAIWLGILLDGIPESFVIGSSLIATPVAVGAASSAAASGDMAAAAAHATISFSLLAGLFLSNFPEALSSSVGMRQQGYSRLRITIMWSSLMILTGIGAFVGYHLFDGLSHTNPVFAIVEGIAAGAMLVMIAETMLPEAAHKGGAIIGMATLFGFLAALFFKTLQPSPGGHESTDHHGSLETSDAIHQDIVAKYKLRG